MAGKEYFRVRLGCIFSAFCADDILRLQSLVLTVALYKGAPSEEGSEKGLKGYLISPPEFYNLV